MPAAIDNAHAATARAAAVRGELARRSPAHRDERLSAALEDLALTMRPLRARLLHSPSVGKRRYEPDVRAASQAVQAERRRVYEMLHRNRRARPLRRAPRVTPHQIRGTVKQAKGQVREIREALGTPQEPGPFRVIARKSQASWLSTLRMREDAAEYLETVRAVRDRLTAADRRFWLWWADRHPDDAMPTAYRAITTDVYALKAELCELERWLIPLTKLKPRKQPKPRRKWQEWTPDSAQAALTAWAGDHGRRPSARDLTDSALPSYGTVHKLLGGLPEPVE